MSDLNLNRARIGLLTAIRNGRVYRSDTGLVFQRVGRSKIRIDARVRELQEHGLVDEDLQLTDAGRTAVSA